MPQSPLKNFVGLPNRLEQYVIRELPMLFVITQQVSCFESLTTVRSEIFQDTLPSLAPIGIL